MNIWEVIGIVALLLVIAVASLYSMAVQEQVQNQTVASTITADGHHVYSVNVSDSAKIREGGA
jgi:uncharacterized membrane protein YjfL (UPF0719 family)